MVAALLKNDANSTLFAIDVLKWCEAEMKNNLQNSFHVPDIILKAKDTTCCNTTRRNYFS